MRGIDLGRTLLLRRVPCKPAFDKSAVMRSLIVLSYIYLKASLDRYIKQQKTPSSVSFISLGLRSEGDSNPRAACDDYTLSRRASSTTRAPLLVVFRGANIVNGVGCCK